MQYRCIESFEVDSYSDAGTLDVVGGIEIVCGSIWERNDETDIIGVGVHLDNPETMEWLEIPEKDLEEYFEPLT